MSAKRNATTQSGKSALKKQAGRPAKKHCIDDAVRMVRGFVWETWAQCMPFFGRCRYELNFKVCVEFYWQFVLGNPWQVIDKDLHYDEAIWVCRLFDTLTRQTLRYRVRKELEQRIQEEYEKVAMYVAICERERWRGGGRLQRMDSCNRETCIAIDHHANDKFYAVRSRIKQHNFS